MAILSASLRLAAIALLFAVTIPIYLFIRVFSADAAERFSLPVFQTVSGLLGATVTVIGEPVEKGPCLIVANHVSWTDIVLVSGVVPCTFIAKSDVSDWPVFGALARFKRSVFVEREKPGNTNHSKDEIQRRLQDGDIMTLFAEGTSSNGNRVLPFKSALLSSVEGTDIPVQPLTIAYTGLGGLPMGRRRRPYLAWYGDMDLLPHLWALLKQGLFETELRFLAIVSPADFANRKELTAHCEEVVRDGLVTSLYRRANKKG